VDSGKKHPFDNTMDRRVSKRKVPSDSNKLTIEGGLQLFAVLSFEAWKGPLSQKRNAEDITVMRSR
jgi:hypothetical protein